MNEILLSYIILKLNYVTKIRVKLIIYDTDKKQKIEILIINNNTIIFPI